MSLFGSDSRGVEIEAVDGGWILKWRKPHPPRPTYWSNIAGVEVGAHDKTTGTEIFTDRKKLMKRLADLV